MTALCQKSQEKEMFMFEINEPHIKEREAGPGDFPPGAGTDPAVHTLAGGAHFIYLLCGACCILSYL